MKRLRFVASTGFRALGFAMVAAICASWAAPAEAGTIYSVTGTGAWQRTQLDPNTHLVIPPGMTSGSGTFEFDFTGTGTPTVIAGAGLIEQISSATFTPQGGFAATVILPANYYLAIGTGGNAGLAAAGTYDGTSFNGLIDFHGAGLIGYDDISSLLSTAISFTDLENFQTTRLGNLVGWHFTEVTTGTFSATTDVPEPATLTLFGAGIAGAFAMRRRKQK